LSLAIGKKGQNARLAARLTNFKIDIKPESEAESIAEGTQTDHADEDEVSDDQTVDDTSTSIEEDE
jgi:N utilization substance protein A